MLSTAMRRMLATLDAQAKAAEKRPSRGGPAGWDPSGYSPELWIGTRGTHTQVADALIRHGLATEGQAHGFRTITINDAGRAALASATQAA